MTLRALSAATFLVGAGLFAATLAMLGEAGAVSAPRHLREMKNRAVSPARIETITAADVQSLPHVTSLEQRSRIESRGVRIEGWNQRMLLAGDGDVHLEITATPRGPQGSDTAYVTCEVTPRWRAGHPGWDYETLDAAFRPNTGGETAWDSGPRRVRVTGWLLYDYQYDRRVPVGVPVHGSTRLSGWEVHPVTRIEAWDDARAEWIEVPR